MTEARPDGSALRQCLIAGRNADGGWGYYAGKASRLEPTCWSLLALGDADPAALTAWPVADGLLRERQGGDVNFAFHALAVLTLTKRGVEHTAGTARLTSALERAKGIVLDQSSINRQNNQLQGWSWMAGTFSWVEPTAWALLALRKRAAAGQRMDEARLAEAEALLLDRCCESGGWNYGNSNMLGKDLRPYVPTTSVALLALQHRTHAAVGRSVAYLDREATSESSAMALSLAALALAAHGRPADAALARLAVHAPRAIELGHLLGVAMALHTVQAGSTDVAFTL